MWDVHLLALNKASSWFLGAGCNGADGDSRGEMIVV